ncbi:MAG: protein kinase domain-containing protein [Lysobacteraceae bacterium]
MTPEEWLQLSPMLDELVELDPQDAERRLVEIAREHPDQAEELRRLLALEQATPDFLARPVVEALAEVPCEGDSIGPYRLERLVGEGGMGQVWQASRADGLYERRVALKLLRPGFADPNLRSRFHRERQILARLGHANIARLLDAGTTDDGRPYLAIEFINGEPITEYAQRLGLGMQARLQLFVQVCGAVSHAHANLVVHRDLKPTNIMVTPAGDVRLLDFGIAKLLDTRRGESTQITRAESRPFTLHYAAPEQIRGEPITTMTDVYALGVVLYELLTGQRPYTLKRDSEAGWEEAILECEPLRPSLAAGRNRDTGPGDRRLARQLAGDLDNIILKALRKAPEQRYPSAEALCQDLIRHLDGRPVLARAQSPHYRLGKFVMRHAFALGATVLVAGLLVLGLGAVHWQSSQALAEARRAQAMQDFVIALFEGSGRDRSAGSVDLRRLLDDGVRRADHELGGQPEARAELLGLIARLHNSLGNHGDALSVLDRQRIVIDSLGDQAAPSLRLGGLVQVARAQRADGQLRACVEGIDAALAAVGSRGGRETVLLSDLHAQRGRCLEGLGESAEAERAFQQALAMRRGRAVEEAESLVDLARVDARAGRPASAQDRLQRAIQLLRGAGAERTALSTRVWLQLSQVNLQMGNLPMAEGDGRQALEDALLNFGALHPSTLEVQRQLGLVALALGDTAHARRLAELSIRELTSRYGERRVELADSHLLLARVALDEGQLGEAADALQRVSSGLAGEAGSLLRPQAQVVQARLLKERRELRRAQFMIEAAINEMQASHSHRHPMLIDGRRLRGEILAGLGDHDGAEREFQAILAGLDAGLAQHPATGQVQLSALRLRAERGDIDGALRALPELRQAFDDEQPGLSPMHWHLGVFDAELHCGAGRTDEGDALLDRLAAGLEQAEASGGRGGWRALIERSRRRCESLGGGRSFLVGR